MSLTPRQVDAYLEFSEQVDRMERANALATAFIGAQGDKQAIEKSLKELNGGEI